MIRLVVAVAVALPLTAAHADPPGLTPVLVVAPPANVDTASYRIQTALLDASAVALGYLASKSADDQDTGMLALAMYGVGAPLLHIYHHHPGRAAASVALRIGLPLLGALVGSSLGQRNCSAYCDNDADIAGTAFGVITGAVAASAIDIGYLSRGEDSPGPAPRIAPAFGAGANGMVRLGVGGSF